MQARHPSLAVQPPRTASLLPILFRLLLVRICAIAWLVALAACLRLRHRIIRLSLGSCWIMGAHNWGRTERIAMLLVVMVKQASMVPLVDVIQVRLAQDCISLWSALTDLVLLLPQPFNSPTLCRPCMRARTGILSPYVSLAPIPLRPCARN